MVIVFIAMYKQNLEDNHFAQEGSITDYINEKGYKIIDDLGVVEKYVLTEKLIKSTPYKLIWDLQDVDKSSFIGKEINVHKFTVNNHKLDALSDKGETNIWILVSENEIIGGYSLPNTKEQLYGGFYSIDGMTLEDLHN